MASNNNRDAEGLQPVENHDFPEVVNGPDARRSSLSRPEVYSSQAEQQLPLFSSQADKGNGMHEGSTYGNGYHYGHPSMQNSSPPQYDYPSEKVMEEQQRPKQRRICGIRRKVFIWVAIVIAVLVILAVVLGAALGVTLNKGSGSSDKDSQSSSHDSRFRALDKTGVTLLSPPNSDTLYAYYIDESGTIVEMAYDGGAWSKNNTQLPATTNVTKLTAESNTPIAAISYTMSGNTAYRQVFWLDGQGLIATSNTTGTTWSAPYNPITNLSATTNAMSLSAVAATTSNGLNGIRVYFGSSDNLIQEIGCDFKESSPYPVWHIWGNFPGSDANSGVSSVIVNSINHLYFRNTSNSRLQQWTWDYINIGVWNIGASSTPDGGVAESGAIAATTDGQNTDYIFYHRASDKQAVEALYTGTGMDIQAPSTSVASIQAAPIGYSLASEYLNEAIVMNQNSTSAADLLFSSVGRNGQSQSYMTSTG